MVQYLIVSIIIAWAVIWAALKTRQVFRESKSGCYGCKGCAFKNQVAKNMKEKKKREKPHCYKKK